MHAILPRVQRDQRDAGRMDFSRYYFPTAFSHLLPSFFAQAHAGDDDGHRDNDMTDLDLDENLAAEATSASPAPNINFSPHNLRPRRLSQELPDYQIPNRRSSLTSTNSKPSLPTDIGDIDFSDAPEDMDMHDHSALTSQDT
jgi:hypothetical protein